MYREFYNLRLKPFQISTDHRFLWLGEKHKEALAVLQYGILDNKGFLLLTGDVGTGKTTLLNALTNSLGDDVYIALISDPGLEKMDFFKFVADSFNLDRNFKTKGDFLLRLRSYLLEIYSQNKKTLLIIDECQHLTQKLLEEVRLLSNIEKYDAKLINIFFVGQSEFNDVILQPRNRAIRQRITINYNILALTEKDTGQYIQHRLQVAGADAPIFTSRAIKEVFKFSNGYPRLINIICDQALVTGYVREKKKVDHHIVAECAAELKISQGIDPRQSLATPEAADASRVEPVIGTPIAPEIGYNANRQYNKPLVFAFIVVLIIWLGLAATFFLNQHQSPIAHQGDGGIHKSTVPDPSAALPAQPSQTIAASDTPTVEQGEVKGPESSPEIAVPPSSEPDLAAPAEPLQSVAAAESEEPAVAVPAIEPSQPMPETASAASSQQPISLADIQDAFGTYPEIPFGFNSNTFDEGSYDKLALIGRYCLQNSEAALVLWGYTDQSGLRSYNLKLSEFRSDVVKYYLMGQGVSADVITTLAMGPDAQGPGGTTIPYDGLRRKVVIEIIAPPDA